MRGILTEERMEDTGTVGYPRLAGLYRGFRAQLQPVVDTLATRRLPSLWLLATIQDALPLSARLDLMMRPAGPSTFSNFDLLPHTMERPPGFPELAVLRTEGEQAPFPPDVLGPHLGIFQDHRAKELLITPTGLRIVWMLAEADRARYGVFRQAEFGGVDLDPALVRHLLDALLEIRESVVRSIKGSA